MVEILDEPAKKVITESQNGFGIIVEILYPDADKDVKLTQPGQVVTHTTT